MIRNDTRFVRKIHIELKNSMSSSKIKQPRAKLPYRIRIGMLLLSIALAP